jgi:hypothetical protein
LHLPAGFSTQVVVVVVVVAVTVMLADVVS